MVLEHPAYSPGLPFPDFSTVWATSGCFAVIDFAHLCLSEAVHRWLHDEPKTFLFEGKPKFVAPNGPRALKREVTM